MPQDRRSPSRTTQGSTCFSTPSRARTKRPWTLPDPWTHRTRPPVLGKPRTVFHERPPPASCPDQEEGRQLSHTACDRPATITEFRCGRQRRSFANPSPAEIVVVDRQK